MLTICGVGWMHVSNRFYNPHFGHRNEELATACEILAVLVDERLRIPPSEDNHNIGFAVVQR
jgi:hypothetical protein